MIALDRTAALLLASGLSVRFGERNKLLEPLRGRPLVTHSAATIASLPFANRIAVVPEAEPALADLLNESGFRIVANPDPIAGREQSLRLGLRSALADSPDAIMVLLGDMPHVEAGHAEALAAIADPDRGAVSTDGQFSAPPVIVPALLARQVLAQERPLRQILSGAAELLVPAAALVDYDTADDFVRDRLRAAG